MDNPRPSSGGAPLDGLASARAVALTAAMLRAGFFSNDGDEVPPAAALWVATFVEAYGELCDRPDEALGQVAALREEATVIPALDLERLRTRQVLFFLDTVSQYVDAQPELQGLPLAHDIPEMAQEFGLAEQDALLAVRVALSGERIGPPLELLFPLLGHDRILIRIGAVASHLLHGRGLETIRFGPDGSAFTPIQATPPNEEI